MFVRILNSEYGLGRLTQTSLANHWTVTFNSHYIRRRTARLINFQPKLVWPALLRYCYHLGQRIAIILRKMVVPSSGQIHKPDGEKLDVSVLLDEPLLKEPAVVVVTDTPKPEEQWTRKELVFSATGFLCCHIIGLPALIMSIFSYVDFSQKNYQESLRKRKTAERVAIAAILTGGLCLGLLIAFWRFCPAARPSHRPEGFVPMNAGGGYVLPENTVNGYRSRIQLKDGVGQEIRPCEKHAKRPDMGHSPTFQRRPIFKQEPNRGPQDPAAGPLPNPFMRPPNNVHINVQFGRKLTPFVKKDDKPQAPQAP